MKILSLSILAATLGMASATTTVIYQTSYSTLDGFNNGDLDGQDGWLGQNIAQVDTATSSVSSVGGPYDRNLHGNGARGGTNGNENTSGTFQTGESIVISFEYQFTLKGDSNANLATVGISGTYNPSIAPTIDVGFDASYNTYDPNPSSSDDGSVKFFPDRDDTNNADAMIIEGTAVGISPGTADGSAQDLNSDPLLIDYKLTKTGANTWEVTNFSVKNLTTSQTYTYSGPTQTVTFSGTDAFLYQQLAPNGASSPNFTGVSGGVVFSFDDGFEPPSLPVHGLTLNPSQQDLDGNGFPDVWEAIYRASNLTLTGDADSDGVSNGDEAMAGTDPYDPHSVLAARVESDGAGGGILAWPQLPDRPGAPQTTTDPSNPASWGPQGGSLGAVGSEWQLTLTLGDTERFYRILGTETDGDGDGVADWLEPYFGFTPGAGNEDSAGEPISYDTDDNGSLDTTLSGDLAAFNEIYRLSEPGTAPTRAQAARFLLQASFGAATEAEVDHVVDIGVEAWIDEQVALSPTLTRPYIDAIKADWNGTAPNGSLAGYASNATIVFGVNFPTAWARSTINGQDQLRQRVAWALSQIVVTSRGAAMLANQPRAIATQYDMLLNNAFGNYEDILLNTSLSPLMGHYLSHLGNRKADVSIGRYPDENYAREIMQLFSIGLWELNMDGTRKLDLMGEPIPTYGNPEITELARVFTGTHYASATNPNTNFGAGWREDGDSGDQWMTTPMKVYASEHDFDTPRPTIVTGNGGTFQLPVRSATNANAMLDVEDAVRELFNHPNTAPFISRQLIQFLVTSNPTPAYVERVANVFADNGSGVRGDLEEVVRAILLDDEARNPMQHLGTPHFGHLREPAIRTMHLARILDMGRHSNLMWWDWGKYKDESLQDPMHSPTVFNYYRPDFRLFGQLAQNQLDSPAFGIADSYSSISFPNHLWFICNTGFKTGSGTILSEDLSALEAMAGNIPALLDHLSLLYCGGTLGADSRATITTALSSEGNLTERARLAAYLVLLSPEGSCLK